MISPLLQKNVLFREVLLKMNFPEKNPVFIKTQKKHIPALHPVAMPEEKNRILSTGKKKNFLGKIKEKNSRISLRKECLLPEQ